MLTTSQPTGFLAKPGRTAKSCVLETMRRIISGAVDPAHLAIRNRLMPWGLIPQNRGEPWQCLGGVLYAVEIRARFR
jgi:hypothetical protein